MSRCLIWGSMRYAVCLHLFFTPDMMQDEPTQEAFSERQDDMMWMCKRYDTWNFSFFYSCRRQAWPALQSHWCVTFSAVHCCGSLLKPAQNIHMKVFLEELGISTVSSGIVQRKPAMLSICCCYSRVTACCSCLHRKHRHCWFCTGLKTRSAQTAQTSASVQDSQQVKYCRPVGLLLGISTHTQIHIRYRYRYICIE